MSRQNYDFSVVGSQQHNHIGWLAPSSSPRRTDEYRLRRVLSLSHTTSIVEGIWSKYQKCGPKGGLRIRYGGSSSHPSHHSTCMSHHVQFDVHPQGVGGRSLIFQNSSKGTCSGPFDEHAPSRESWTSSIVNAYIDGLCCFAICLRL